MAAVASSPSDASGSDDPPAGDDASVIRRGMALLWRSIRTHPVPFAVSMVGATVFALMTVAATSALGAVTDDLVVPGLSGERDEGGFGSVPDRTVWVVTGAVVVIALVRALGVVARRYYCGMTTYRMGVTWRSSLADRYLDAPLRFHAERPAGQLMAHADNDAMRAIEFINPAPFSFSAFVIGIVAFVRLLTVDWVIALVALAIFPTLVLVNRVYTSRVEAPAARGQARYGDVAAVAHESFDGALVVRLLGLRRHERERFARATDALRAERVAVGELRAWFEPGLSALPNLGAVLALGLGAWRLSQGQITEGGIVEALALFAVLTVPMRVMGYLLQSMPPSVVSADRLDGVLSVPDHELHPARGTEGLPGDGPLGVSAHGLRFAYEPGHTVLDGVELEVAPGEVLAVTGATASGKTTLCLALAGLLEPDEGTVRLGGVPVVDLDRHELPRAVGMVFQESFLFADSVRANVVAGPAPREDGDGAGAGAGEDDALAAALGLARAERFVAALPDGLDTVLGERGVTLSGGQRQRLALARALVRRPRLLILDDATSAIDTRVEEQILTGLGKSLRTTTVVVAHRVSTIRLADRVVYLEGGRVAASGPHDELLRTSPGYAALVRAYEQTDDDLDVDAEGDEVAPEVGGDPGRDEGGR